MNDVPAGTESVLTADDVLRTLIDLFPFQIWAKGADGRYVASNEFHGTHTDRVSSLPIVGSTDVELFNPELGQLYRENDLSVERGGRAVILREATQFQDKTIQDVEVHKAPIWVDGEVRGTVGYAMRLSDLQHLRTVVGDSKLEYVRMLESLPFAIVRYDEHCRRVFVNERQTDADGVGARGGLGLTPTEHWPDREFLITGAEFQQRLEEVLATGILQTFELGRADGDSLQMVRLIPEQDPSGQRTGVLMVALDISELAAYRRRLQHLAFNDELTGLPNRSQFLEWLETKTAQAVERQETLGVLVIDLDQFKLINDSLGHAAGDEMLFEVARRIDAIRADDDVVARLSGDEFAVLATGRDDAGLTELCQDIIRAVKEPMTIAGQEHFATCSVGVARCPEDAGSAKDLMAFADAAMYEAKKLGRDHYQFFVPALQSRAAERMSIGARLRRALDRDEFSVVYQPIFHLPSGGIQIGEALLRWHNQELGPISPVQFIPIAEELGLITDIGAWVLQQACVVAHELDLLAPNGFQVSVNLSPRQLVRHDIVGTVESALSSAGCDPTRLVLEITEGVLIDDSENSLDVLRALADCGVRVALDDFGTGYSSLAYLTRFPMHALKIDRSFTSRIGQDRQAEALVKAIIAMAESLSLQVIAEGIEHPDQLARLREWGCTFGQGFLLGHPQPASQLKDLIRASLPG